MGEFLTRIVRKKSSDFEQNSFRGFFFHYLQNPRHIYVGMDRSVWGYDPSAKKDKTNKNRINTLGRVGREGRKGG